MSYFNYCQGLTMTSGKFDSLFEGPPRKPESQLTQREMDLAASVQAVTEAVMLRIAQHLHRVTRMKNLVLAGGVALNCVGNGRLLRESPFEKIWIQPAAGDAGGALGAATFVWHQLLGNERKTQSPDAQAGSLLGPSYSDDSIASILKLKGASYKTYRDDESLCETVADLISDEKVVGWFQGRMEVGPRALGNRSILADPRSDEMKDILNRKVKHREPFRPFAPSVLADRAGDFFTTAQPSPFMLLVCDVKPDKRDVVPAITHVDGTARVQTVERQANPRYYDMIEAFGNLTGVPMVLNTSFNVRGEPIVNSPEDAVKCFMGTGIDYLVIGDFVATKTS